MAGTGTAGLEIEVDGEKQITSTSYFRGAQPQFYPEDRTLERDYVIQRFLMKGWAPEAPFLTRSTPIVAFGSCFAQNVSNYLHVRGYNVLTKRENKAYVTTMGDGMVHTHAIRQQFEWAWEERLPQSDFWIAADARKLAHDDAIRRETRRLFDEAEVFIITLGLSELWYDEVTGEVFWRQPPKQTFDQSRHRFRVATHEETIENLRAIHRLVRTHRPDAHIVFTVSPIPLRATFRDISCISANAVSKAILRAAVDQMYRETHPSDPRLYYFPSYDIVLYAFNHQWHPDRRHVYSHVLKFNMMTFEHYFCRDGIDEAELVQGYQRARSLDLQIGQLGHESVAQKSRPADP